MLDFQPGRASFAALAARANTVPVYCTLLSDQLTPVSAFERLAGDQPYAFLLESVIGGEKVARHSFLGIAPVALIESKHDRTVVTVNEHAETHDGVDPLERLEQLLGDYRTVHPPGLPRFLGGAVGYAGYDIARHYERLAPAPPDDRGLPDMQFGIYDRMVVFDHVRKVVHIVAHAHVGDGDAGAAYDDATRRIEDMVDRIGRAAGGAVRSIPKPGDGSTGCDSNISKTDFEHAVEQCKAYIRAGDIFQVVLSQRLSAVTDAAPFDIYRALRVINPSPFMFFVRTPSVTLVGSSPEILCRIEGRTVTTRPLAGTRPRGATEGEDRGLEAELLADPKERAEHVMLVDL
ncbi:MAG: anthranilate synthase component I family protein, partial [Phycisphaerae bacterium]